jgi:peptide/nickel transport system permease protein
MRKLLRRRLLAAFPLLLAVTFVTQALLIAGPGNYFDSLAAGGQIPPRRLEQLKRQFGLDSEEVTVRYGRWARGVLRGDWGYSFRYQTPVGGLIRERLGNTLLLTGAALLLAWGLAIPLGVLAAARQGGPADRALGLVASFSLAMPTALASLLAIWLAARTGWFPTGGAHDLVRWEEFSALERFGDRLRHLFLPAVTLCLPGLAQYLGQIRSEMIETLGRDHIRTARAKGLGEGRVLFRHALPEALNPAASLFGFSLAQLLTGAVLTEQIFAWPGLGRLSVEALLAKDEPLVMASVTLVTLMLLAGNLIADLLLARLDPRVRMEGA